MNRGVTLVLFLFAAVGLMVAWILFVRDFASFETKNFIALYHVDKLIHILGGAFLAGSIYYLRGNIPLLHFVVALLVGSLVWEFAELVFDADVGRSFTEDNAKWQTDTFYDVIASVIGGMLFWCFTFIIRKR